jgi:acyl dehydratase
MFDLPGLDVDLSQLLHGEQEIQLHDLLPPEGEVRVDARVADVFDKGKAALLILESVTSAAADGRRLCTNRFAMYFRGEGGFGGDSGPATRDEPPDRPADATFSVPTMPQQALLYRLSGDRNPLHCDPGFAAKAGFDRPILHGLCAYGVVCKAVVDRVLDGAVGRVSGYRARFAGVVFPGETVEVSVWDEGDRLLVGATSKERGTPVLSNAVVTLQ